MVRPAAFGYNPETAATNSLQKPSRPARADPPSGIEPGVAGEGTGAEGVSGPGPDAAAARAEFERLARALEGEGVSVCIVDDTPMPPKPDAVFPNNWVSFHADGTVVLYPMQAISRRRERRREVIDAVAERTGFKITRVLDLSHYENEGRFLEGTGSLVLDHVNRTAYASISPRTHPALVEEWSRELGYEPVVFEAVDRVGAPIYHTNVVLCIGERVAVAGTGAMSPADRARVVERLRASGREVVEIGKDEIERFAGNMLELASWDEALGDCRVLVMSASARRALRPEAFARLAACTDSLLAAPVPVIERLSGGSVRCMLAEIFLPT